jgi:hypothetical protein
MRISPTPAYGGMFHPQRWLSLARASGAGLMIGFGTCTIPHPHIPGVPGTLRASLQRTLQSHEAPF